MINVSANLKNAITGKGTQLIRITGSCYDTSNVLHSFTFANAEIVQGSFFVDKRCVSGSKFSLGNTVATELGFELFNANYTDWLLEGESVQVELGGYVGGTATYFSLGYFTLDKPVVSTDRLVCKGYDKLTKLDGMADNWVMKTATGENILGQAVKPVSSFLMNDSGYQQYIKASGTSPFYTSDPYYTCTGMVPFSVNEKFPETMTIKGMSLTSANCYFMFLYYYNGALTPVGLTFPFDNYGTLTQLDTNEYEYTFSTGVDPDKTAIQEYLETNVGSYDYYALISLASNSLQTVSSLEIRYNVQSAPSIQDTVEDICDACGVTFLDAYPAAYNLALTYRPLADYSKYTYRTILGQFAKACGANVMLWGTGYGIFSGQLRFATPYNTGITLDETDVLSADIADEAVVLSGTRFVDADGALFINRTVNTEPYKFLDFSGCPVFPTDAQTAVDNLAALTGTANKWLPGSATILAQPWLEPMDIVTYNYSIKPYHSGKSLLTRVHITADGVTHIYSAGYDEGTTNSSGYMGTSYSSTEPQYNTVYSTLSTEEAVGVTTDVPLSTFPYNMPKVNDYVESKKNFGIVTGINGSFASVKWLESASTSQVITQSDWSETDTTSAAYIQNKPTVTVYNTTLRFTGW